MKCPACGFDTPVEQGYCDFCKEPFPKEKPKAKTASGTEKVDISPNVFTKLTKDKEEVHSGKKPKKDLGDIAKDFAHLDAGGKVEEVSPLVRKLAWAFLAILVIWMSIGMIWMIGRANRIGSVRRSTPALFLLLPKRIPSVDHNCRSGHVARRVAG